MGYSAELVIKNNKTNQKIIALAMLAVGGLMIFLVLKIKQEWSANEMAGFSLGILLVIIGAAGFLSNQETTTTIDLRRKIIRVEDASFARTTVRVVMFKEIKDITVEQIGDHTDGSPSFHLVVQQFSGKNLPILVGIYDNTFSENATILLQEKILKIVRAHQKNDNHMRP
jgi:hypothetical protein